MTPEVEKQIEDLVSDREKFNKFVYTSVNDAVNELEKRRSENLQSRVTKFLSVGVPEALNNQKRAVVFRQLVTPNYELRRFISLVDAIDRFSPLFFEYANDKYTDNNEWKYHLGKMIFPFIIVGIFIIRIFKKQGAKSVYSIYQTNKSS